MAIYDGEEAARQTAMRKAREELKKFLGTPKGKKALPNWFHLSMYLDEKDKNIKDLEKKVGEYKKFFKTLSSFLPRQFSMFDKIG